ncbi:pectate lyase B [Podospora appendiculata]|uniref:Pectate lyase B n=1 Tax=Podospora appendiculata TaxID=314037 RepID=A0AAE1CC76_9PEZI|nr:pectate lyase B [Podospora appendiculata]
MKSLVVLSFAFVATASPTINAWRRAVGVTTATKQAIFTEVATLGYATQNGGTSGGSAGNVTTVTTLAQFTAAVDPKNTAPAIVLVSGVITGNAKVNIGSNKTIIGLPGAGFNGVGLQIRNQNNVIVRNIVSSFVKAANGDGLTIQASTNIWVDHCEFYSDLANGKDYYDGLIDVTHASDFITISHTYFHDHWKTSLVGHSDSNGASDTGHLRVTYAYNYWKKCGSRGPSLRFGTGHIYNSLYESMHSAINTRMGAKVLVESNVFKNVTNPIQSVDSTRVGYAMAVDNDFGGGADGAPGANITDASIPYNYTLLGPVHVTATVLSQAGANLVIAVNGTTPH